MQLNNEASKCNQKSVRALKDFLLYRRQNACYILMFWAGDKRSYYHTDYGYSLSGDLRLGLQATSCCRLHSGHYLTYHLVGDAQDCSDERLCNAESNSTE